MPVVSLNTFLKQKSADPFMTEFGKETIKGDTINGQTFMGTLFKGIIWDNVTIQDTTFQGCEFVSNRWNNKVVIEDCQFSGCAFTKNTLNSVEFIRCHFHGCDFEDSKLEHVNMNRCQLTSTEFVGDSSWSGVLNDTALLFCTWTDLKIDFQSLTDSRFSNMDCTDKAFPWAKSKALWDDCKMGKVSWAKQRLSNCSFNKCEFEGLDISTASLNNIDFTESQFAAINAEGFKGENLQMGKTKIESGNFKNMEISLSSIFWGANLKDCDFSNAKMGIAVFEKATLEAINFANAEFTGCNLSDAHLKQVSFKDAKINNLNKSDAVMDGVEGLG